MPEQNWREAKARLDPQPFSEALPYQLNFWDNTAWQTAQHCWRHYLYSTVRGLKPKPGPQGLQSVHLSFGSLVHEAADLWVKATALGIDHEEAVEAALGHVLDLSWPADAPVDQFGGCYGWVFQCRDRTRSNKAKGIQRCPWSKAEHLDGGGEPGGPCPGCGGPADWRVAYICSEKVKNRRTLCRAVVALLDALHGSNVRAKVLPDGRIGSELRWFQPLALTSPDGQPYHMTGSFDGAAEQAGRTVIPEYKTTQREPNEKFWTGLEMSPQVMTYSWAGNREFGKGTKVLIFAIHIGVGFVEVYQRPIYLNPDQLAEWEEDLNGLVQESEIRARMAAELEAQGQDPSAAYPRRLSACSSLPGAPTTPCPFRDYCRLPRSDREQFIQAAFEVAHWSPLGVKGTQVAEEVE